MGAVSAPGIGVEALWSATRDGISGVRPLSLPRGEGLRVRIAAQIPDFDADQLLGGKVPRTTERYSQFALVAAAEAVAQAGIAPDILAGRRSASVIGTGIGGAGSIDESCYIFYKGHEAGLRNEPMSVPRIMPSSAVSHVSIAYGVTGPSFGLVSACASGAQSIGCAAQMIRAGLVDRALAGGTEACITPATMRAWELLRVLSPRGCQPFSAGRSGMVIGEGAAVFVLESEAALRARGGEALAWLDGYGTSSDAKDMIQPDVAGAVAAMAEALEDAGVAPERVGYVNAHGTGTVLNDINEAHALREVFGVALDGIPVSSSKPVLGHALGAAGALELVVAVQSLRHQIVPPQANFEQPDPRCNLHIPTGAARPARLEAVMSNSFAFGGINASLLVQRAV